MIGRRILVLAPHPDDEVVGAAAAIGRALAAGAGVYIFHLTTGVPERALLWPWQRSGHALRVAIRRAEAAAAAAALGAELAGFGDRPTRTLKDHLPAARREVEAAIERFGIETLWVPAYEGGHQDHDAAHCLASTWRRELSVWEFAEYNYAGGVVNANAFLRPQANQIQVRLSPEEVRHKGEVLGLYRSEQANLGYTGRERECFRRLVVADYSRPPHEGRLFYQRFQWVPFRHPRIDFTRPEAVCRVLSAFLERPGALPLDATKG
jgi:LmbE family N-acetylglucosaminyl deacetylase